MLEIERQSPSSFIRAMLVDGAHFMDNFNYEFEHNVSDDSDSENELQEHIKKEELRMRSISTENQGAILKKE